MPYKRKYKKRKYKKKVPWYKRKYSAMDVASSALDNAKYIRQFLLNTERKNIDTSITTNIDTAGLVTHLTNIVRGDDQGNRSGRYVKAINFTGRMEYRLGGSSTNDVLRVLLVQARTPNAPAVTDVLTSSAVCSLRNLERVRDYNVLIDRVYTLDDGSHVKILRKLNRGLKHRIQWEDGSDTPQWGHFYLNQIGTRTGADATAQESDFRIRYLDN